MVNTYGDKKPRILNKYNYDKAGRVVLQERYADSLKSPEQRDFYGNLEYNRIAFLASKKVGNSVVRHHLTRLVREAYRLEEKSFRRGYDIVVVLRVRAADADYHTIRASLLKLSDAHGIRYLKD